MNVEWHPRSIVVGVDGSESSEHAAATAVAIALQWEAALTVGTVVRPPEGWWGIVGAPPPAESLGNALTDAQRVVLERTVQAVDLSGVPLLEDDKDERWDRASVHEFEGTYGDYVLAKVSKVFPELRRSAL